MTHHDFRIRSPVTPRISSFWSDNNKSYMSFGIIIKIFFSNLVQSRFYIFSRLDLTSNRKLFHLSPISEKISFESLSSCHAKMSAFFWPLFLPCWIFVHQVSKLHSPVNLSYRTCSIRYRSIEHFFFHYKRKNSFLSGRTLMLRYHHISLPFAFELSRRYIWRLWCRKGRPNACY